MKIGIKKRGQNILNITIGIVLFSFIAPFLFTRKSLLGLDFIRTGAIGDTIGGIMSPFVAIAGVLITFAAFYIQYIANRQQRAIFLKSLKIQKENFQKELETSKIESKLNKFENQFYEMIRLHKENVNEIAIEIKTEDYFKGESILHHKIVTGRNVFKYYIDELEILFKVISKKGIDKEDAFFQAYEIFFHGFRTFKKIRDDFDYGKYEDTIKQILFGHESRSMELGGLFSSYGITPERREYDLFIGRSSYLGHYYRHLYQIVKFVVKQEFMSYEDKRKYLRILRAQLSNQEQVMLFYNWLSDFGSQWEEINENGNKFFSDYRMIHNIWPEMVFDEFDIEKIFRTNEKKYRVENGRENDCMFEFEG